MRHLWPSYLKVQRYHYVITLLYTFSESVVRSMLRLISRVYLSKHRLHKTTVKRLSSIHEEYQNFTFYEAVERRLLTILPGILAQIHGF